MKLRALLFATLLLSSSGWAAADPDKSAPEGKGRIELTFLGTGAPRPSPDRYGASILVEAGDRKVLID